MKLITKETDYAVRALLYLAKSPNTFIASREIAQANHIPLMFMRRVLQTLTHANLIESREGAVGGVRLNRQPEMISLIDIIELYQSKVTFTECLFRKRICENVARCPLRRQLKKIEQKIIKELKGIILSDLLVKNSSSRC